MKANSNLAILDLLARQGAGFDIVSGGELLRVLAAGGDPRKVIFSGVGKSVEEMRLALSHDILCFNVESIPELHRLNEVAAMGKKARISLRVNPNVDAKTHPYIATGLKANKFGVAFDDALDTYRTAAKLPHLEVSRHRLPHRLAAAGRRTAAGSAGPPDRADRPAGCGRHRPAPPGHRRRHRHRLP
jgi:diaminopimelate decarboxylase